MLDAARESGLIEGLAKNAPLAVARFVSIYDRLSGLAIRPVEEILGHVLNETGYREHLEGSKAAEDEERLANIEELLTAAREFDEQNPGQGHLEEFLEQICLVNDTDAFDVVDDQVTLMTLHASKGLEFPVVFIIAIEEGLLPHERAQQNNDDFEEERRLLFVGMTRAEEELHLSRAMKRLFRGSFHTTIPSPFLFELPLSDMESEEIGSTGPVDTDDYSQEEGYEDPVAHLPDEPVATDEPVADGEPQPFKVPPPGRSLLKTAAELAGGGGAMMRVSPEAFQQGMLVRHPEYGLGKIVALSGSLARRVATIAFAAHGERRFVLSKSLLQPLKERPAAGSEPKDP